MPFYPRQKMKFAGFSRPYVEGSRTLPNGRVETFRADECEALPPAEYYKVENLMKAGVSLKQVDSKCLGVSSSALDVALNDLSKPEPKPEPKQEQTSDKE